MKCILFSRVSTLGQDVIQQTNELIKTAHSLGYTDDNIIIIENKESAVKLSFEEREGITQLISTIENEPVERVIIYEVSRIARRPDVFYKVRDILIEHKIQLQVLTPALLMFNEDGSINENSNLLIGIFLSMAESEGRIRKARFKRGKERSIELGKAVCLPAYGYRIGEGRYVEPDPHTSEIVKWVFNTYANTESTLSTIAQRLINNGTFTCIFDTAVGKINKWLKNEAYIGKKPYPAIISKELFQKCQEKLTLQHHKVKTTIFKPKDELLNIYLCRGLVFHKGSNTVIAPDGPKNLKYKRFRRGASPYETVPCIKKDMLDPLILGIAIDLSKKALDKTSLTQELMSRERELHRCELVCVMRMKATADKIDKVEERLIEGNLSEHKANELSDKYKKEFDELINSRTRYKEQIRNIHLQLSNLSGQKDLDYDKLTIQEQYDLIHKHIKRIELSREYRYSIELYIDVYDVYGGKRSFIYHTRKDRQFGYREITE